MKYRMYKYKSLKDQCEIRHLRDLLQQKIWMSSFDSLNDPFEGHFKFEAPPDFILKNKECFASYFEYCRKNGEPNLTKKEYVRF